MYHRVGSLRADDGHDRLPGVIAERGVQRREGAVLLVLGETTGELALVAQESHVAQTRASPAHVHHDEAHRSSDGSVGAVAGPERAPSRRDRSADVAGRSVDDKDGSDAMRRRLQFGEVEFGPTDRLHGRDHNRQMVG